MIRRIYIAEEQMDYLSRLNTNDKDELKGLNHEITQKMTQRQCVEYAVFAAEQVIDKFEKKHPEGKRPRQAIEAAKEWLKNPSEENRKKCKNAAYAANAYVSHAAYAAYAAAAATYAATYAAYAAAAALAAYYATNYAGINVFKKILEYGISLVDKQAILTKKLRTM